jgi:hypothetical protein
VPATAAGLTAAQQIYAWCAIAKICHGLLLHVGELTHRVVLLQVVNSGVTAGTARQQGEAAESAAAVKVRWKQQQRWR